MKYPLTIKTIEDLEDILSTPSPSVVSCIREIDGDLMILGAGGKIGPSLTRMALRAVKLAGVNKKVYAVSRFMSDSYVQNLESLGAQVIKADLQEEEELWSLPNVKNILYLVGYKFGTSGQEYQTWAINSYLPGRVIEKFKNSRIVALSSGNVYPFVSVESGGATEECPPSPIGEYAQSRLGGERILEYFSRRHGTPVVILRLNYAVELRYGVLHDVALAVKNREPIDLRMGYVNVIWQGDVNEIVIRALAYAQSPPLILNITGPETISIRWLANEFGKLLNVEPIFTNQEEDTALLSNAFKAHQIFGYPQVPLGRIIVWVAEWVKSGGISLNKPTHFQERGGRF